MAYGTNIFGQGTPLGAHTSRPAPVGRALNLPPGSGFPGETAIQSELSIPPGRYNSSRPAGASIFGNEVYSDSSTVSSVPTTLQGLGADKTVRVGSMMPVSQTAEMAKRIGGANYGPSEYDGGVFGDFPVPVGSALAVTNTFTAEQSVAPGRYVDSTRNGGVFGDFPVPVGATLAVAPLNYGRTQRGGVFSDFTVPVGTQMTVSDANYAKFQRGGVLSGNSAGMRGLGDSNGCHLLKGQEIPYTWSCTEPNAILNDFATGWVAWKAKQLSMPDGTVAQRAEVIKAAQAASGMSTWKTYVSDVQTGKYLPGFGVHVPGGQPSQEPGAPPAPGAPPESGSSNTTLYVGLALTALLGVGGYMWWKKHKAA